MKWIDNHDDYFLRDFSGDKENNDNAQPDAADSLTDRTETSAAAPAPSASASASASAAPKTEFSFTGEPAGGPSVPEEPKTPAKRRHTGRRFLLWTLFIVLIGASLWGYIYYYVPYTSDMLVTGYVTNVEKRGLFFKTFEGEMVAESRIPDQEGIVKRDIIFSIPSDTLARHLQSLQGTGRRVTVTFQKYYGALPWRGDCTTVATAAR